MIRIETYDTFPDRSAGLGQDVSCNLADIVKVASLFVKSSKIHQELKDGKLKALTIDINAPQEVYDALDEALNRDLLSKKELVTLKSSYGRKDFASGLIRALFPGQRNNHVIKDWPAENYLSVAIGMGLVDIDYFEDKYYVTDLGREAVRLLNENKSAELDDFMLDRIFEYPYAAWLIRLVNSNRDKMFTKFDLGEHFGFIDEPGFISLPESLYVEAIFDARAKGLIEEEKQIRSNYESTADKYMRWLAGVLVKYNLLKSCTKEYKRDDIKKPVKLAAYKVTLEGIRALNRVNGGSRFKRSTKRVRWEYLAPKVEQSTKRKTLRALILKYLSESPNGLSTQDIANKINAVQPEIQAIPEQIQDDALGLSRLGIDIQINSNHLTLKDKLFDFIIPIKKNETFKSTESERLKKHLLGYLKNLNHKYLQGLDIAYKKKTSNAENTLLEILSTELFTQEMDYKGAHLGGSNKPDGFVYDSNTGWILDSKAYSKGFSVSAHATDPMGRYIQQYRDRNDKSNWWEPFPDNLSDNHFIYISSFYIGNYEAQLKDFEQRNNMTGGLVEYAKLILLAEKYQRGEYTHNEVAQSLLDSNISWKQYSPSLLNK